MNLNTNEKTNLKNNFIGNSSKCSLSDSVNNFQYLERLSQHQLLQQTERLVGSERKLTYQILRYLQEIEKRRLFLTIGYGSMFDYLTKHLKYSESAAYRRLQAARLLNENQNLAKKLQDGRLNLSQMVKIQQSLKSVSQRSHSLDHAKETKSSVPSIQMDALTTRLENRTLFETEKILSEVFDIEVKRTEKLNPQKDESVRMEFTFSKHQYELLQKVKSLVSHQVCDQSLVRVFDFLVQYYLTKEKHLDQVDAKVAAKVDVKAEGDGEGEVQSENKVQSENNLTTKSRGQQPFKRKPIPRKMKLHLLKEARYSCQYVDQLTHKKCSSSYQLQIDHIVPIAKGGSNELTNLRILCAAHNRSEAVRWGLEKRDN